MDETRTYNCYGCPVEVTLPEKEHLCNYSNSWPFHITKVGEVFIPMNHGEAH